MSFEQFKFIVYIGSKFNRQLSCSTLAQISQSYAHRQQLVNDITIDLEQCVVRPFLLTVCAYAIDACFVNDLSEYVNKSKYIECDRQVREYVLRLIVEKLRLFLSDEMNECYRSGA